MKKTLLIILATLFIVVGGIIVFIKMSRNDTNTMNRTNDNSSKSDINASSEILVGSVSISIRNFAYSREKITIKKGSTITWANEDSMAHTVTSTSSSDSFDSGTLEKGQTFSKTFNSVGTFDYFCSFHSSMKAEVVVVE
ncbi:cupredoxin domain-containing protein [Candidatus Saccharibacteria bacterium]|nr:cupredoxin domain-containing protein [Candidatus Saccharibacteria bacterium]